MERGFGTPATIGDIEQMALAVWVRLPENYRVLIDDVLLQIEEFADDETLDELGLDPHELTGIYEGTPLAEKSVNDSGALPDRIRLFRRAILDEWVERGNETLEQLVAHVLIHEVGHHFGLSDADMHALEATVAEEPEEAP